MHSTRCRKLTCFKEEVSRQHPAWNTYKTEEQESLLHTERNTRGGNQDFKESARQLKLAREVASKIRIATQGRHYQYIAHTKHAAMQQHTCNMWCTISVVCANENLVLSHFHTVSKDSVAVCTSVSKSCTPLAASAQMSTLRTHLQLVNHRATPRIARVFLRMTHSSPHCEPSLTSTCCIPPDLYKRSLFTPSGSRM
eukprot:693288-Amphidinium_carterae.2